MSPENAPQQEPKSTEGQSARGSIGRKVVEAAWLKGLCLSAGADDVGLVEIDRPELGEERGEILSVMGSTRTVMVLAYRLNRESMRTVYHSLASLEFRQAWDQANRTARRIVQELGGHGIVSLRIPAGFPFEADRWPARMWLTSDKILAEQAGLGRMGWNRVVLHPGFGSMVVLGTVLLADECDAYDKPMEVNPCIMCKMCVSVCPVGAVAADGNFDFASCYTHNYRERLGGFADWVERIVSSKSVSDYRKRVSDSETISMWQNLSMGAQTRCDRCMAVCPAGQSVSGEYESDRKEYMKKYLRPFMELVEPVYVVPGSDAEAHVSSKFPHKTVKRVSNGIRPNSAQMFLQALPIVFQRNRSEGLDATYHFVFKGSESCEGTVVIRDKKIEVTQGLRGTPDLRIIADSRTWISFLAKETSILRAVITGKIRVKGPLKLMMAFAKCFPS